MLAASGTSPAPPPEEEDDAETLALKYGEARLFPHAVLQEWSPSRRNGISADDERMWRTNYCEFIRDVGMRLKMCAGAGAAALKTWTCLCQFAVCVI